VFADNYVEEDKKSKKKKRKKAAAATEEVAAEVDIADAAQPAPSEPETAPQTALQTADVESVMEDGEKKAEEGAAQDVEEVEEGEGGVGKKKKKKKKKGAAVAAEDRKTKPTAHARRLKEHLDMMKAQEEDMKRQEEEAEREAERVEEERLEKIRLEEERKQRKKDKDKERKERKKKEGTWLTKAEREKRDRAQAALEAMKQQGFLVPGQGQDATVEVKPAGKVRYGGRQRKKKPQQQVNIEEQITEAMDDKPVVKSPPKEEKVDATDSWEMLDGPDAVQPVEDAWDASDTEMKVSESPKVKQEVVLEQEEDEEEEEEDDEEDESEEEEEDEDDEDDSEESGSDSSDDDLSVRERIEARKVRADQNKDPNVLRAPILCVLGHVDTGKTTILDKLRRTNVQEGEAGGITQQIGATNVPIENILTECSHLTLPELNIPGMLIIDTPGHESFSNLRSRGSSLCDMAILVVDIMHGLEQQTIESINLLKKRRTPFIIALNKIDRLYEWKVMSKVPVEEAIKKQKKITRDEFDDRAKQAILQIAEQGLNARLFYENPDVKTFISVVPVSGISGDGMADLMSLACDLAQRMLGPQLIYKDVLEAMVLEVKAIHGLGTTVDIILRNGQIKEGDSVVLSGIDGAFSTTVRAVLTPHPMKEMRVKNNYIQHKVVRAAQGIKICARDMEKTLAGMAVHVAKYSDEAEVLMADANRALREELKSIKLEPEGVYVQASTLGSLEALLQFLKDSKIKYSGVSIGPVHKKDVMKASVMLQHDKEFACLLAFDVKVERDAQETADSLGVRIFTADIIYHLFDQFMGYKDELKERRKEENKNNAVFPCRLRIIPTCIFNTRDPIVIGVTIINGVLRSGTPICVPSKEFIYLGVVTSLEMNNKQIEVAHTGHDVCIKIENIGGDAPKLYGRHFDENDVLVSKITRESIDTLKEYFRDDMTKENWKLIVELKKLFEIL